GHVVVTDYSENASDFSLTQPIRYDAQLAGQINALPHVRQAQPFIIRPAILKTAQDMEGIKLKGISAAYSFPEKMEWKGNKIDFGDSSYAKQIILSQSTADKLNIAPGEELQLYFIERGSTAPRIRKVTVAGVFHTGMVEVDKDYALCDLRMLQRINGWQPDEINGYQVDLDDYRYMDAVA